MRVRDISEDEKSMDELEKIFQDKNNDKNEDLFKYVEKINKEIFKLAHLEY